MSIILDRVAVLGLAGLFCLPFLIPYHSAPLPGFYSEWLAGLFCITIGVSLLQTKAFRPLIIPKITILPLGVIVLLAFQLLMDVPAYASQARLAILYLAAALIMMLAIRALIQRLGLVRIVEMVALATLIGGVLSAIAAAFQSWLPDTLPTSIVAPKLNASAYGNLGQPNHFANYSSLALVALFYLAARHRIAPIPVMLMSGLLVTALALSGSRSSLLYLATLFVLAFLYHRKTGNGRDLLYLSTGTILFFIALQFILPWLSANSLTSASRIASEAVAGSRGSLWRNAFLTFLEHPWFGAGYQHLSLHYVLQQAAQCEAILQGNENIGHGNAHNIFLQLLAEFGLAAGILLISSCYLLWSGIKRFKSLEHWLVWGMLGILIIHSLLEYPLHYLYFLAPAAILAGMASEQSFSVQPSPQLGRLASAVLIILSSMFLTAGLWSYSALEQLYTVASQPRIIIDERQVQLLHQAELAGFFEPETENIANSLRIDQASPQMWSAMLSVSERAVHHKATASRIYRHILLLSLNNSEAEATRLLAMATTTYPRQLPHLQQQLALLQQKFPGHRGLAGLESSLENLDTLSCTTQRQAKTE